MYNRAMEGQQGASKNAIHTFDFYTEMPGMKSQFMKYSLSIANRSRNAFALSFHELPSHRATAVNEDQPTCLDVYLVQNGNQTTRVKHIKPR